MPVVDVMDDTFLRAPRAHVRAATGHRWAAWLPGLSLVVAEDRGEEGVRWHASTRGAAPLRGTAEVWLEQVPGGTVAHLYVRLAPLRGDGGRRARRLPDRLRRTWKRGAHAWKDSQEGDVSP